MAKLNCSDLAIEIEAAFDALAQHPQYTTFDQVASKIEEMLPDLTRIDVVQAVEAVQRARREAAPRRVKSTARKIKDEALRMAREARKKSDGFDETPRGRRQKTEAEKEAEFAERLRKQIAEAEERINKGVPRTRKERKQHSKLIRGLQALRDDLTRREAQIERAKEIEARLASGNLAPEKGKPADLSPETAEAKARADAARERLQEARLIEKTRKRIEEKLRKMEAGEPLTGRRARRQRSDVLEALRAEERQIMKAAKRAGRDPATYDPLVRLRKRIAEAEERIEGGGLPKDKATRKESDPATKPLRDMLADLDARERAIRQKNDADLKVALGETGAEAQPEREASPETEAARDAARASREVLLDRRQQRALGRQIAEIENALENGTEPEITASDPAVVSEALAFLRERRARLQRELDLGRQIEEMREAIESGDIQAPQPRQGSRFSDDPAVERLEIERDRLRGEVRRAQADLEPKSLAHTYFRTPFRLLTNLKATGEFSGVLNQGGFVAAGNPLLAARVYKQALGSLSEMGDARIERYIKDHPRSSDMFRGKLEITDLSGDLTHREEGALSRIVDQIPLLGATNRFHKTFLNLLRVEMFDMMVSGMEAGGPLTQPELRAIANFVNVATGRGDFGKLNSNAAILADFAFAPRWMLSRLQILIGQPWWSAPRGRVRNAVIKQYARYAVGRYAMRTAMALVAAALNDLRDDEEYAKIVKDPRSTDFWRLVIGDTRIDPNAGLQTYLRTAARVAMGSRINSKGEVVPLADQFYIGPEGGSKYGQGDAWDEVIRFLEGKSSVGMSVVRMIIKRETHMGLPLTRETAAKELAPIPFTYSDLYRLMQEDMGIPSKAALSILAFHGMFVTTYSADELSEERDRLKAVARERQERRREVYEAIRDRIEEAVGADSEDGE